jgi:hypothetical protein
MTEATTQRALAMAEVNPIITELAAFEGTVSSIDVIDEETQADMGDLIKLLQSRRAKIEAKRKHLVQPLNAVVREINALFKTPITRIDNVITIAKKKTSRFAEAMLAVEREKKRLAEEEARKEREEAERLAKKLAAKTGTTGEEVGAEILDQAEKKEIKVTKKKAAVRVGRGKASTVITTTTWKAAVTDKMELIKAVAAGRMPADVLEINMAALNKIATDTRLEREVDGVRYWETVGTTVR